MAPVSRTCRNFLFDRSPRTKSEQSSRSPRITWWKTRPDSCPRWMRGRLVLSWEYSEKKSFEKVRGFNLVSYLDIWGKEIHVSFIYLIIFVREIFTNSWLLTFVAGEWTESLPRRCVDQQRGIYESWRINVLFNCLKIRELFEETYLFRIYFHVIRSFSVSWRI